MDKVISTKIDSSTNDFIEKIAGELNVTKSWIISQALRQYIERYENYLSDIRIASITETVSHEKVLKQYGL